MANPFIFSSNHAATTAHRMSAVGLYGVSSQKLGLQRTNLEAVPLILRYDAVAIDENESKPLGPLSALDHDRADEESLGSSVTLREKRRTIVRLLAAMLYPSKKDEWEGRTAKLLIVDLAQRLTRLERKNSAVGLTNKEIRERCEFLGEFAELGGWAVRQGYSAPSSFRPSDASSVFSGDGSGVGQ